MKKQIKIYLLIFAGLVVCGGIAYHFTMHKHAAHKSGEAAKKQIYQCPMHPNYTSDKPGKCPICGMDLVPVKQAEESANMESMEGMEMEKKPVIPGLAEVNISPEREQIIGVKTTAAKKRRLTVNIRASARIAHDVELYNAIIEYRQALAPLRGTAFQESTGATAAGDRAAADGASPESLRQAESLLNSSLLKLKHIGLSDSLIEEFAKSAEHPTNLIYAGKPGGTVWVYAQVYEYESGMIKPGQVIEVSAAALPGRKFRGVVKSLDTFVDEASRTLKVRAEMSNSEGLFRPDMYVDAVIHVDLGERLAIPDDAVLDTGTRQIVFVKKRQGIYEPREVRVGQDTNGYYEILSGLSEGEQVVTSANFLIDSESRLKSAIQDMQGMPGTEHKH